MLEKELEKYLTTFLFFLGGKMSYKRLNILLLVLWV